MIVKALQEKERGRPARFGPKAFPEVDFGETLLVPTPWEGGDGKAINEARVKLQKGLKHGGTMSEREEALKAKDASKLTTK